ncbi:hypothetical protein ABGI61_09950 [Rheinheimera sp. FR7-31]|uniref:hypothetical protein n=1 Tax=Rheinheimera fenheensis TaxID=3152295 RepID=UPI00325F7CB0
MQSDIPNQIIENGWLQGSIAEIPEQLVAQLKLSTNIFLVATHSCDITNWNLKAIPYVALLPLHNAEKDNGFLNAKHARKLQFESVPAIMCQIEPFVYVPREIFAEFKAQNPLSSKDRDILAKWLGNSYSRSAFPTKFNDRFASSRIRTVQKQFERFEKFLAKHNHAILNIFIQLDQWGELNEGQNYLVDIVLVISLDFEEQVNKLNDDFDELMLDIFSNCEGIELDSASVLTADQFTLQDLMQYKLWQMDNISFKYDSETVM